MQNNHLIQATTELVKKDFELNDNFGDFLSEEDLLFSLADHIAFMLERELEHLMSSLYRMDISEKKVAAAILPNAPEPANIGIARLIIERQKQRIKTKQEYKQEQKDWFDF